MTISTPRAVDARLDIVLEREVTATPALLWRILTEPEHIKAWATPRPWMTVECEMDARPGGIFRTLMRSPEGEQSTNLCCVLDVVDQQRIVWTNALLPAFRPAPAPGIVPFITAEFTLQPHGRGTRYVAHVMHRDETDRQRHIDIGFHDGWNTVVTQMIAVAERIARGPQE
jgi:uncharacterized protein YndB with AHSA1/START domain